MGMVSLEDFQLLFFDGDFHSTPYYDIEIPSFSDCSTDTIIYCIFYCRNTSNPKKQHTTHCI